MLKKTFLFGLMIIVMAGLLSACGPSGTPPEAIEAYLEALVAKDEVLAINLSCASWEEGASVDGSAFEGVDVRLENVVCQIDDQSATDATVSCIGNLVFTYAGGEDQFIDLSGNLYQATLEDGEWKMCGYR